MFEMTDEERAIWYEELENAREEFVKSVFSEIECRKPNYVTNYYTFDLEGDKKTWYSSRWYSDGVVNINAHKYCHDADHEEDATAYGVAVRYPETWRDFDFRLTEDEFERLMQLLDRETHENEKPSGGEQETPQGD